MFAKGPLKDDRGIGRVARELLKQLTAMAETHKYDQQHATSGANPSCRTVYFFPSIHWCPDLLPRPSVVAIHDVIPLIFSESFTAPSLEWKRRLKPIALQAEKIITVSKTSAKDIEAYLSVSPDRITVIYNGVTKLPVSVRTKTNVPSNPYIVFLGTYDHHKNLDVVWRALKEPGLESLSLLMVGDNKRSKARIAQLGLTERVKMTGRISDSEAGHVISKAKALVLPSLYEGFGLPPLEAILLGTPSICSRRPAMTEVLDGLAFFADPDDPAEWARCLRQLMENPPNTEERREKAEKAAELYSWETAARKLLDCCFETSITL